MNFQLIYTLVLLFMTKSNGQMQNKCDLTAQPQCSTDCSSILLCAAGMENPVGTVRCPLNSPFCERGVCSEIPGNCALTIDPSSFLCTSAGVFPDPSNCVKYHYCSVTGSTSMPYDCPFGNIFNSKTKVCQRGVPRGSSRKICEKITCKETGYVAFTANPSFYALCSSSIGVRNIIMYKCADEINQVFNAKTRSCEFTCKSSGYFTNPLNCSTYYICNGHKDYLPRQMSCPEKHYFNGTACIKTSTYCPPGSIADADTDADIGAAFPVDITSHTNVGPLLAVGPLITGLLLCTPLIGPMVNVGPFGNTQMAPPCPPGSTTHADADTDSDNAAAFPTDVDSVAGTSYVNVGPLIGVAPLIMSPLLTSPLIGPLVNVGPFGNKGPSVEVG